MQCLALDENNGVKSVPFRAAGRISLRAKEEKIGLTHIFPSPEKTHTFALCGTQYILPTSLLTTTLRGSSAALKSMVWTVNSRVNSRTCNDFANLEAPCSRLLFRLQAILQKCST
eukprot:scaffold6767_cov117-Skeletonema_dohrnii-CCMP3373.AAC.5